jgi:hypothetical protein
MTTLPVEVSASVAQAELQVDGGDRRGHVTGIRLVDHAEVNAFDVGHHARRGLLQGRRAEHRERQVVEGLDLRVVAGGLEAIDYVVDRLIVARQAGEPVPAVGVGNVLKRALVLADARERHALQQLRRGVVGTALAGRRAGVRQSGVQRDHRGHQ